MRFLTLIFVLFPVLLNAQTINICSGIQLLKPVSPPLTSNEKAFICPSGAKTSAWQNIPISQRKLHLKRILQDRGHHYPSFKTVKRKALLVEPGPISSLAHLDIRFTHNKAPLRSSWSWIGKRITPVLLDTIETDLEEALFSQGFACAKASASAPRPDTGRIIVQVNCGSRAVFDGSHIVLGDNLRRRFTLNTLSRHFALTEKQPLDDRKLRLTTQRMEISGVVKGAYFIPSCQKGKLQFLELRGTVAKPRLITLGVGVDTEGYVKGRIFWQHSQMDSNASSLTLSALTTAYLQQLSGDYKWYVFDNSPRFHLLPQFSFERKSETYFETYSIKSGFYGATSMEMPRGQMKFSLGPAFNFIRSVRGPEKGDFILTFLEGRIDYLSHNMERNLTNPVEGVMGNIQIASTTQSLWSDLTATRIRLFLKYLWNMGGHSPPPIHSGRSLWL